MSAKIRVAAVVLLVSAAVVFPQSAGDLIRHSGLAEFGRGTLGNGGANIYVSHNGRVQVINRWDLNRDGFVDVLISNDHDVFEIVDAFIYWGERPGHNVRSCRICGGSGRSRR